MSKANPLAGLIGYGDSDEESDEEQSKKIVAPPTVNAPVAVMPPQAPSSAFGTAMATVPPGIHPAPVPYCPWSACYDEGTGFTYYWNQQTNAVTWEAPPEYLLAVKIAQQHMSRSGSAEVSAEEWQLYQQALAEKQNAQNKAKIVKPTTSVKRDSTAISTKDRNTVVKKRKSSEDEPVKIELITSYHNSDSESNDEENPVKPVAKTSTVPIKSKVPKKAKKTIVEYGPALPPTVENLVSFGPEIPPELISEKPKSHGNKVEIAKEEHEEAKSSPKVDADDIQDDDVLLKRLKDKAKLLEKLGGEIPSDLQKIIEDESRSITTSPRNIEESSQDSKVDTNIDDLLDEIEKKELPKVKSKVKEKLDIFSNPSSQNNSRRNSPKSNNGDCTPPLDECIKPLFPSSKSIEDTATTLFPSSKTIEESTTTLFPSAVNIVDEKVANDEEKEIKSDVAEKKTGNMYLMDANEPIGNVSRKKLRISNSVLPERKKPEAVATPAYTTKYSQHIEGFSSERTGLGFTKEEDGESAPKNTISYGNGLRFTKGEVLNEKDEELEELTSLVEAKLKYLNTLQVATISPVQEMLIQMQTLSVAFTSGALTSRYYRRWSRAAADELTRHEVAAAPRGWTCVFQRSEGRYKYRRESDGFEQWEYPALANTDMEICTTPPHPGAAALEEPPPPPPSPPRSAVSPSTPPPPVWDDPPPPGTDDLPPPPPPPSMSQDPPKKQEIGDALMSFYNDIAELEKTVPTPPTISNTVPPRSATIVAAAVVTPEPPPLPETEDKKDKEVKKKKSKVKISASIGRKHKTVSSLVAKWQQVAEEINSD